MDPLTAALNVIGSLNDLIKTIIDKASPVEVDALIQVHLERLKRMHEVADFLANKLFKIPLPASSVDTQKVG